MPKPSKLSVVNGHAAIAPKIGTECTIIPMFIIPKTSGDRIITAAAKPFTIAIRPKCECRCTTNSGKTFIRNIGKTRLLKSINSSRCFVGSDIPVLDTIKAITSTPTCSKATVQPQQIAPA